MVKGQEQALKSEYVQAIKRCSNDGERKVLEQWAAFVNLYSKDIKEFPEYVHNMALNQCSTSAVVIDTKERPVPEVAGSYPLFWTNRPKTGDQMEVMLYSEVMHDLIGS